DTSSPPPPPEPAPAAYPSAPPPPRALTSRPSEKSPSPGQDLPASRAFSHFPRPADWKTPAPGGVPSGNRPHRNIRRLSPAFPTGAPRWSEASPKSAFPETDRSNTPHTPPGKFPPKASPGLSLDFEPGIASPGWKK